MKIALRISSIVLLIILSIVILIVFSGCNSKNENDGTSETYDVPHFVGTDYIEIGKIYRISKFRSSEGHDYSDDFESCRNMKHYFQPYDSLDWSAIKIFSPIEGTIFGIYEEWAGTQIQIQSEEHPSFFIIIFHIDLTNPLEIGDVVSAGQQIGTHIGSQTMSDIAVGIDTGDGWKLVSYFDVLTDSVFQIYQMRGITSRNELIISKEARDADPLSCDGEEFIDGGDIENWVILD